MKRAIIAFIGFLPAIILGIATAQVSLNSQGTGGNYGAPVAVGTSTPVLIMTGARRCMWTWLWAEAGNLACQPVPVGAATPLHTPVAGAGMLFTAAQMPWSSTAITDDPSVGWQCVSTSGTLNIYVYESATCLHKGDTP